MSLDEDFKRDPEAFLKTKVIMVPPSTDDWYDTPGKYQFTLEGGDHNLAMLKQRIRITGDFIYSYYLPWETGKLVKMQLSDEADFFFTSEMTDCRFTVLVEDPKRPLVAHVAGTLNKGARNKAEKDEGVDKPKLTRRLSTSGSLGGKPKHTYEGQRGDNSSSAFVFGVRNKDGNWKFYAQITKGILSSVPSLVEDLKILGYVDILNL